MAACPRLGRRPLAPLAVFLVALLGASGGDARAATTVSQLPLNGFRAIVVDDSNSHVFVSGSPSLGDASVAVAGFDGTLVKVVSGIPGASGMVHDGARVYVAECGTAQLAAIDTGTLDVAETIDSGATIGGKCEVALAGGRLWFVTDAGVLASVSEAAPHVSATYAALGTFSQPLLTGGGTRLVVADTDVDLSQGGVPQARVYDVSAAPPQLVVSGYPDVGGYGIRNFADASMSADGSILLLSSSVLVQVDPTDLSVIRFPKVTVNGTQTPLSAGAVEVTPSGEYTAATGGTSAYSWHTTGAFVRATNVFGVSRPGSLLYARGVALSADGRYLFAVGGNDGYPEDKDAYLWTIDGPALATTSLTLTSSSRKIRFGRSVKLTAHLTHFDADSILDIYATPYGASRRLIASGHPDRNGNLVVTVSPRRNTVYQAEHAATAHTGSAISAPPTSIRVAVVVKEALSGYYATSGSYHLYHYSSACASTHRGCPEVTLSVSPNHAGQTIYVSAKVKASGHWYTAFDSSFKLNSKSRVSFRLVYRNRTIIGHQFKLMAEFLRDADHFGNRSPWRYLSITQ